jgi:UDP-N-acetyl-D-mannosaminuronate dehydrogenase
VRFCDPYIPEVNTHQLTWPLVPFTETELADADVVVVLVDHPEFDPATIARAAPLVFDAKNLLRDHTFRGELL